MCTQTWTSAQTGYETGHAQTWTSGFRFAPSSNYQLRHSAPGRHQVLSLNQLTVRAISLGLSFALKVTKTIPWVDAHLPLFVVESCMCSSR